MVGRNLLKYIADYQLASFIHVVDKRADLSMHEHVDRAFSAKPFNIIVNLASETQYGHLDIVYERSILQLRTLCAQKAALLVGCERYIEASTCQVYECSNNSPAKENKTRLKPWTAMARYHLEAEKVIATITNLPWVIVRLPIVYGPGDIRGLMPQLVRAAVYEKTGTCMEFLWGKDLRIHAVHVQDVAAAIWHIVCVCVLVQFIRSTM
ncbi:NAD-dependent epimerase/dehydratase [Trypanosoma melophagium]|uniref:NAD-dependent epimerase/dehydratase n=1 Tax=Trypanosoma melophagium TaxID=715481 RepID=UPI00351A2AD7|nr:NAD-dependent epimerase/dehydratase [Trypanosoma melophagium]